MGWKTQRGTGRNKKKLCAAEIKAAHDEYWQSPVSSEQQCKIELWVQNLISFDECFTNASLKVICSK